MKRKGTNEEQNPDEELRKLGQRIKILRIRKGYTSYENFANEHNISRSQFGRYEKGQNITYLTLLKIMSALGVTPEDFFSEGFK